MVPRVHIIGVTGVPEVKEGDDLASLIVAACGKQGTPLEARDILIVTQKIVSKAEGRVVDLDTVVPSDMAVRFAEEWEKDPRHVELMLRESRRIVRMDKGNIITETRHGFICAASGVDASNIPGEGRVCLLPEDPDSSARRIRDRIGQMLEISVAVIVSDTWGRPWREGAINVAIGVAGISPIRDYKGTLDASGRLLRVSTIAVGDELASAAELVTGKADNVPVTIIRGYDFESEPDGVGSLLRDVSMDLFR